MIQTIIYPERSQWASLMERAISDTAELRETVASIISEVRTSGDEALRDFSKRFDGVELGNLKVSADEIAENMTMLGI